MGRGRPLKYGCPIELRKKIDAYFESIQDEHWVKTLVLKKGTKGKADAEYEDKWVPVKDRHGNIEKIFLEPPMITGLALYLGTSRETLMEYSEKDNFVDTIKYAKAKIEKAYELADDAPAMKIFKLSNFGWKNQRDITTDQKVTANVTSNIESFDLNDRISQLVKDELGDALQ